MEKYVEVIETAVTSCLKRV